MSARDELVLSLLPLGSVDRVSRERPNLATFWPRFDTFAPWHVRLGLAVMTIGVVKVLPWLVFGRPWSRLGPSQREQVLQRAEHALLLSDLMEVGKLVACFAWFDEDDVQRTYRGDFVGFRP